MQELEWYVELRAGTEATGSLGEEAGATDLWGSLSMEAGDCWGKRHWMGNGRKDKAEGCLSIFYPPLNYVQSGNDSQALSSGTFPPAGTRPGIWSWG